MISQRYEAGRSFQIMILSQTKYIIPWKLISRKAIIAIQHRKYRYQCMYQCIGPENYTSLSNCPDRSKDF